MDAAMLTALGALLASPLAAAAAAYGSRGATRAAREGGVITGYDSLSARLMTERDKAEKDQATAEAKVAALELEVSRLRFLVTQLGGTP
jgi:nitrous oxide reductase accessory protein NosL